MKKWHSCFLLLALSGCFENQSRVVTGLEGKFLPAINLTLIDSLSTFSTSNIAAGRPFILFCYEPNCPFCREQTESIIKNIDKLKNVDIYMVSSWAYKEVQEFVQRYHLSRYQNIIVIQDPQKNLDAYFQPRGLPFLAFYDSQKRLKRAFLGAQDIDVLKNNVER